MYRAAEFEEYPRLLLANLYILVDMRRIEVAELFFGKLVDFESPAGWQ